MNADELKVRTGYAGKSQQWQYGFDLACREKKAEIDALRAKIDRHKAAHKSTADSFTRILAALDHASPESIVHHLNGEGACLQMINDMRYQIDALKAQRDELLGVLQMVADACGVLDISERGQLYEAIAKARGDL